MTLYIRQEKTKTILTEWDSHQSHCVLLELFRSIIDFFFSLKDHNQQLIQNTSVVVYFTFSFHTFLQLQLLCVTFELSRTMHRIAHTVKYIIMRKQMKEKNECTI